MHTRIQPTIPYAPSDLILISDLDGTFLGSDGEASRENLQALERFYTLGGRFGIASGRTENPVKRLGIPTNIPSILYNGAVLYDLNTDEVLWRMPLEDSIRSFTADLIRRFPELGIEVVTQKGTYVLRQNDASDAHIALEQLHPLMMNCEIADIREPWIKIMLEWSNEKLLKVEQYLHDAKRNSPIDFSDTFSLPFIIELIHQKANKGIALSHLAAHLGVTREQIIVLGDNLNDLEMLRFAGTSIVPAGAVDEVKDIASYISVSNDEHLMMDVLRLITGER